MTLLLQLPHAPMRLGAAVSLIVHTGRSDDSHSPDEWASVVVRRISPASLSIDVVWWKQVEGLRILHVTPRRPANP